MSLISLSAALSIHLVLALATTNDTSNATTSPQAHLVPWKWHVKPNMLDYVFPSSASTLGNIRRRERTRRYFQPDFRTQKVISFLSCGCCGRPYSNNHWWFMFLFALGLNLGANALIAFLYLSNPGYGQGFSIGQLTLFWTTRPRLGWFALSLMMYYNRGDDSGLYEDSAKGAIFAEVFLLLLSTYYTGMTAHFAMSRVYHIIGRLEGPHAHDARIMYAGALMSLVVRFLALFYIFFLLLPYTIREYSYSKSRGSYIFVLGIMYTTWLASCLF